MENEEEIVLIDVADLDLGMLRALPESALVAALARALGEGAVHPDSYAQFTDGPAPDGW